MSLSISDFKGRVKRDLYHRPWAYEVRITNPGKAYRSSDRTDGQPYDLRLRTENVSLPGASFMSVDNHKPFGTGQIYNIPYIFNPQEISMTHVLDKDGEMLKALFRWMDNIADISGVVNTSGGTGKPGGAYYFNDYVCQMEILMKDPYSLETVQTIKLIDTYPISLDQTQMSWNSNDETTKITVSYRYVNWTMY